MLHLFRPDLGNFPVLAEFAVDITPGGSQGKSLMAGVEVEERLFFDWVNVNRTGFAINQSIISPVGVFPHSAIPPLFVSQMAFSRAEMTFDFFVRKFLIIAGFYFREMGRKVKGIEVAAELG